MKLRKNGTWVLWYECIGFGLILLLTWLNELIDLPKVRLTGQAHISDFRYNLVETVVILVIWGVVFLLTKRLVTHLHHLEGFLRVCAWCRKVGYRGKWVRLEEYFAQGFNIETTHGMCPECLKKIEEDTKQFYRSELEKHKAAQSEALPQTETGPRATGIAIPAPPVPNEPAELQPEQKAA